MRKNHDGLLLNQLGKQALLAGESLHRIQVETHNPWISQMRSGGNGIGNEICTLVPGFNAHTLQVARVTRYDLNPNAWDYFRVAIEKLSLRLGGHEKLLNVTGLVSFRGIERALPLCALDEIPSARKSGDSFPLQTPRVPAAVVEMKVSVDYNVDVLRLEPQLIESRQEHRGMLDVIDVLELRVELVPNACFHENVLPAGADQQAGQGKPDSVALVRWGLAFPQGLRHDAEHLSSIEGKSSIANCVQFKIS